MFDSILVVCVGNICRSPTGERLLKQLLPDRKISSAGIGALVDKPADESAEIVAQKHGLSLKDHLGKQLTSSMCKEYDLILVMEKSHIDAVCRLAPKLGENNAIRALVKSERNSRSLPKKPRSI